MSTDWIGMPGAQASFSGRLGAGRSISTMREMATSATRDTIAPIRIPDGFTAPDQPAGPVVHRRCVRRRVAWQSIRRRSGGFGENDPRPAAECDIGPQPIEGHDDARAKTDQEKNMGDAPDQPGGPAKEPQPAESRHRIVPTDRREVALMTVPERRRR